MTPEQMKNDPHLLLAHAVMEQTKVTNKLLQKRSESADPIANLLSEDGSAMGESATLSKLLGARGAASLEIWRRWFEKFPEKYTQVVRENIVRHQKGELSAGDPRVRSSRQFFNGAVPMGKGRTIPYIALGLCTVFDQMDAGLWVEAEATVAALLVAIEQSCLDKGRWDRAWLMTHLPEPNWHMVAWEAPSNALRPFAKLADPAWTASVIAYTKDATLLEESRKRPDKGKGKGKEKEEGT